MRGDGAARRPEGKWLQEVLAREAPHQEAKAARAGAPVAAAARALVHQRAAHPQLDRAAQGQAAKALVALDPRAHSTSAAR